MTLPDTILRSAESFAANTASELTAKLRAELDDGPLQAVWLTWRVKSKESIDAKLRRRISQLMPDSPPMVNDFIGVRAVVLHGGLVNRAVTLIRKCSSSVGLDLIDEHDFFVNPARGQYRSIHLDFKLLSSVGIEFDREYGVEIQVTTYLQHLHGLLSHRILYKGTANQIELDRRLHILERMSARLRDIDLELAELFRARES